MNLTALTKRLEALEEQRKATEKKPWVAVKRIWDDGKLISERIWQDGKEVRGHTGPFDVVISSILITPINPISTAKN